MAVVCRKYHLTVVSDLVFVLKKVIVIMSKSCVEVKFVRPIVRSMRTFLSGKCVFVGSVETW